MAPHKSKTLKRRGHRREPKSRFFLYCEGKKTEPDYFAAFRRWCADALIDIETIPAVGVPNTIAQKAAEKAKIVRRESRRNSFGENDQVWAVFDRDNHPDHDQAIDLCRRANVRVARSNPCFELWLILHFQEFDRPDDHPAVQAFLKHIQPDFDKKRSSVAYFETLMPNVEEAANRAEVQLARIIHGSEKR